MIFPLFRRSSRQDTISALYGTIVAQARLPCFYREYGVPDTVNGRFDLLVLHLAIVLDRLEEGSELRAMGQALFDRFCEDMDDNLREIGIGDLSVPREMQRIGEAFYGRAQAYRSALASEGNEALVAPWPGISTAALSPSRLRPCALQPIFGKLYGVLRPSNRPSFCGVSCEWRTQDVNVPVES
jgi:hypothetical protein